MVRVDAGTFQMGCDIGPRDHLCTRHEQPRHVVYLDAFDIDRTEVTTESFRSCVMAGGCTDNGVTRQDDLGGHRVVCNWERFDAENHPMNCVTWHEAEAFCTWAGKRLPTEAEWEKAARGTDGRRYPWGDSDEGLEQRVVVLRLQAAPEAVGGGERINTTWPVGSVPEGKSPYGAFDMLGNVWEWTADIYDAEFYGQSPRRNPRGPDDGAFRVIRGDVDPKFMRVDQRAKLAPHVRLGVLGFRCASG